MPSGREQYLQSLASLSELTRAQAERVAALLAKQGEVQSAQVGRVAEDMMRRTQKNREILTRLVQREVKRQLGVLGMATRDEVARLQQRVRALEQEIERSSQVASSARRATRSASAGSGTTRGSTRASKAKAAGSGTAKPSTRTRAAGAGSRSTRSSPGTRRTRGAAGSTPPESAPPSDTPPASTPE